MELQAADPCEKNQDTDRNANLMVRNQILHDRAVNDYNELGGQVHIVVKSHNLRTKIKLSLRIH